MVDAKQTSGTREDGTPTDCACNGDDKTCVYHQDRPHLIDVKSMAVITTEVRHGNVCVLKNGKTVNSFNRLSDDAADYHAKCLASNMMRDERTWFSDEVKKNKERIANHVSK